MNIKKSITYTFLLSIAYVLVTTVSCKKYPDGPLLSLRTKTHRVIGEWQVEYFSINGYDSTEYLRSLPVYGTYIFKKEKGRTQLTYNSNGSRGLDTNQHYSGSGQWEFRNNKNNIEIDMGQAGRPWRTFHLGLFYEGKKTLWQIQRLTEKEMWLKGTYTDGREYFYKFSLKSNR